MPLDFPTSPTNGQYYNGFVYNAANETWDSAYAPRAATIPISSPNAIINGAFDIWQRGTSATSAAGGGRVYLADRWFGQISGTPAGVFTMERATDSPDTANAGSYSLKAVVTTADASTAANEQYWIGQIVEGSNFASFQFGTASAQTITVSFWVKASIVGTFGFCIRNEAANRSYVSTYTISATNTWEKKTITVPGDTTGTWLKDSGNGARLEWALNMGSDLVTATPNAWTATNDMTTSAQTNFMATVSNSFQITAVQLEAGAAATDFRRNAPSIQGELAACQRYYYRKNSDTLYGAIATGIVSGYAGGTIGNLYMPFPVNMRTIPSSIESSAASTLQIVDSVAAVTATSTATLTNETTTTMGAFYVNMGALTSYRPMYLRALNTAAAYIGFNAEL